MAKKQLILSVIALAVVFLLLKLPKSVVDNASTSASNEGSESSTATTAVMGENDAHLSAGEQAKIDELKEAFNNNQNSENFATFANSLIEAFVAANRYDSAAVYAEKLAEANASIEHQRKAGDMYYEAFTYAMDPAKAQQMGEKARYFYTKVREQNPQDLDAKVKTAMTYVSSSSPMQGIQMLREVLDEDQNHELAIYNLGLLSMQSGQHDKAAERFEKLVQLNPNHLQAQYLLGVSYFESGNKAKAKAQFEHVKTMDDDPSVIASADEYLNRM